ncbi:MAG: hypothetical protein ACLQBQ_02335 [Smithella sp.]
MKAKQPILFSCKNATDEFIATDEWDARHYDIKRQLDAFQKKDLFEACKEQNFAHEFIDHAEKLIKKTGYAGDLRSLLKELRTAIKNYDSWRIFMQTLRLVTLAYRAGTIPDLVQAGAKVMGGGKKSAKVRQEKSKLKKELWQAEADKILKRRPTWSRRHAGNSISKKIGGNPDTIRKSIKKTLP